MCNFQYFLYNGIQYFRTVDDTNSTPWCKLEDGTPSGFNNEISNQYILRLARKAFLEINNEIF